MLVYTMGYCKIFYMKDIKNKSTEGGTMAKQKNKKLKLNYFIWGQIDGESKSFYLEPDQLDDFMKKQNLSKSTIAQVYTLEHCQGLELAKGFTIERRLAFN